MLHATETGISSGTDRPLGSYANVFTDILHVNEYDFESPWPALETLQFDCIC